jgi:CubicO group peptidase (beta-lactamase class C family)
MVLSSSMDAVDGARQVLLDAIRARVFSGAAAEIGRSAGSLWQEALGSATFEDSRAIRIHTPFDLASLTKPVATTTVLMALVHADAVQLGERVSSGLDGWRGTDREPVTVGDLLEHASGLAARLIDRPPEGRRAFEHEICAMPLEYPPRTRSVYSDLGFILLGFLAADRGGRSLAEQFTAVLAALNLDAAGPLAFGLTDAAKRDAAPTEPLPDDARRGRMLTGEVHDEYAALLGGEAGHAGLFGTAPALGAFARAVLRAARGDSGPPPLTSALLRRFLTRSTVPGSSRALGWDTMLPTSSCGRRMSPSAFGHVGFTGTSLWIDPGRDRYFVLLTNRAYRGGSLDEMRQVRRAFHEAGGEI